MLLIKNVKTFFSISVILSIIISVVSATQMKTHPHLPNIIIYNIMICIVCFVPLVLVLSGLNYLIHKKRKNLEIKKD